MKRLLILLILIAVPCGSMPQQKIGRCGRVNASARCADFITDLGAGRYSFESVCISEAHCSKSGETLLYAVECSCGDNQDCIRACVSLGGKP